MSFKLLILSLSVLTANGRPQYPTYQPFLNQKLPTAYPITADGGYNDGEPLSNQRYVQAQVNPDVNNARRFPTQQDTVSQEHMLLNQPRNNRRISQFDPVQNLQNPERGFLNQDVANTNQISINNQEIRRTMQNANNYISTHNNQEKLLLNQFDMLRNPVANQTLVLQDRIGQIAPDHINSGEKKQLNTNINRQFNRRPNTTINEVHTRTGIIKPNLQSLPNETINKQDQGVPINNKKKPTSNPSAVLTDRNVITNINNNKTYSSIASANQNSKPVISNTNAHNGRSNNSSGVRTVGDPNQVSHNLNGNNGPEGRMGNNSLRGDDDRWVWGAEDATERDPTTPVGFDVDDRAGFAGDACPQGMVKVANKCVGNH